MNARSFVFFSRNSELAASLAEMLESLGVCYLEQPDSQVLELAREADLPDVMIFDFVPEVNDPGKLESSTQFASQLLTRWPQFPCLAVGCATDPQSALSVLRGGVREFVDVQNPEELISTVQRILRAPRPHDMTAMSAARASGVLIKGVRPGVGASTLAVHLASMLHEQLRANLSRSGTSNQATVTNAHEELARRVLLMDFGLPLADGLMYMNAAGSFDALEALQNISRLDPTMLLATIATDASQLGVLPLSSSRSQIEGLNLRDVGPLCTRLQSSYGAVVADIGGWQDDRFFDALVGHFSECWLVVDQSVGALVSLADCVDQIKAKGLSTAGLSLIVNRYDLNYGLTAQQIAERFGLPLKGTLPDRNLPMRRSANTGKLLHQVARRDPYIKSLKKLLADVGPASHAMTADSSAGVLQRWSKHLSFNFR